MNMLNSAKSKDSQWLQIEICREYLQDACPRAQDTCKYAHVPRNGSVEVVNGKVMTCYDSCKGRCTREICKYYHPPPVVMEQLMLKGRNSLAVKPDFAQQVPQMFMPIPDVSTLLASANRSDPSLGLAHKVENGCKRSAEVLGETFYPSLYFKRPHIEFPLISPVSYQPIFDLPTPADPSSVIPLNASFVNYTDGNGQLLDNLPVCQDFNRNMCTRMNCRFVHLLEPKKLEIHEQRVQVCRDHVTRICRRSQCKYYHIPIQLPPAVEMTSNLAENDKKFKACGI